MRAPVRPATAHLRLDEVGRGTDDARRASDGTQRRVVLAGETVDYLLIRARRRTIGMEVDLDGLTVRARTRQVDREGAGRMARPAPGRDAARVEVRRAHPLSRPGTGA